MNSTVAFGPSGELTNHMSAGTREGDGLCIHLGLDSMLCSSLPVSSMGWKIVPNLIFAMQPISAPFAAHLQALLRRPGSAAETSVSSFPDTFPTSHHYIAPGVR